MSKKILKNKFESKSGNSAQKNNKKLGVKEILLKKPGFVLAIIAVIVIILILVFVKYDSTESQQKTAYAQQFYEANQSDLNIYLQSIIDEQAIQQASTLDESYLSSTKSDIEWLITKEKELYNSRPINEVYPKEAAFTLFAQKITQVNSGYAYSVEGDDYSAEIAQGLAIDFNVPELLTSDELAQTFTNADEITVYSITLSQLFTEYIDTKKEFIKNITSTERQYVEAKKIILLSKQSENYWFGKMRITNLIR